GLAARRGPRQAQVRCGEASQGASGPFTSRRTWRGVFDRKSAPAIAMKLADVSHTGRGVGELLREVAEDGAHLARQEVHLERIEFAQIEREIDKGSAFTVAH